MGLVRDEPPGPGRLLRGKGWPCGCRERCRASGHRRPVGLEDRPSRGSCSSRRPARCRPLAPRPPSWPWAERWAFTWVLFKDSASGTGPAAAILSNMRCQMPRDDQRVKRLRTVVGGPWARHVAPAATRLQAMEDVRDHPPVVGPGLAGQTSRQVRLDGGPGPIRMPERMRHDPAPLSEPNRNKERHTKSAPCMGFLPGLHAHLHVDQGHLGLKGRTDVHAANRRPRRVCSPSGRPERASRARPSLRCLDASNSLFAWQLDGVRA